MKIYENFDGTLETVCNREVFVLGGSTVPYFALLSAVLRYYSLWYVNHRKQDRVNPVFTLMYRHEAFLSQKGK